MINNTNVENTYTTNGVLATVYPITFQGAVTDSGTPHLRVMLKTADGESERQLVYNVDYETVQEEVDPELNQNESMAVPPVIGIKLLNAEDATAGNSLTITRATPFVQDVDFQVGRIDPEQVEKVADASVLRDQELLHRAEEISDVADEALETATEAVELATAAQDDIDAHEADLNNPHQTSLAKLTDTDFTNLQTNQFLIFNGTKWVNVYSSAVASWGNIVGNITDQTDLMNKFSEYVRTDGTSVMTAPLLMRATDDFKCAIAPYWDGVGFFKLNNNNSVTLMASLEYQDSFAPAENNVYNIGSTSKKWKNLYLAGKAYVATINNGADLSVPNKTGTLATKEEVDLAANSGRMITDQGVWYAKMYAASTVPTGAEYDGKNYADFSQVDSDNNPVIKIYTGASGSWTLTETITPPADYDGYVSITSKIWDIIDQTGQQGGRVLWNHQSKEFTPYPQIISLEDIEVTGNSTVIMPDNPSANQIVNKDYVDTHAGTSSYHPDLLDWKWTDHELDNPSWLRADTFSWQPGSAYEPIFNELFNDIYVSSKWRASAPATYIYTKTSIPAIGDTIYSDSACTTSIGSVEGYDSVMNAVIYNNRYFEFNNTVYVTPQTETIAGTTITFYQAQNGYKIVMADQESNVSAIYNATGVAWYYVLDATNKQFKLPRGKHNKYAASLGVVGNGMTLGLTDGTNNAGVFTAASAPNSLTSATNDYGKNVGTTVTGGRLTTDKMVGITTDASKSGIIAQQEQDTDQYKYLYFYVGEFTQTALENTAGLNAELFNGKVDLDAGNLSATGKETVAHQAMPSSRYDSLTVGTSGSTYTAPADGWFYISAKTSGTNYQVIMAAGCMSVSFRSSSLNNRMILPVSKGMVMTLQYDGTLSDTTFRFVYANGAQ